MLKEVLRAAALCLFLGATALPGCLGTGSGLFGRDDAVGPYDYLRGTDYTTWHIEVDASPGQAPRQSALDLLDARMSDLARKDHITIARGDTLPSKATWTTDDLVALREAHQDRHTGGKTVVTYVAYLDGKLATEDDPDGGTVLGLTLGHDLVVLFKQQIENACAPLSRLPDAGVVTDPHDYLPCYGGEERIEQAVLIHEFGHAIGLVNRGIPMVKDHEDHGADHERHSDNEASVMYWAVDSAGTLGEFTSQIPLDFDADDKADVCAAGGRC